ncbi:MAG: helix-turn-helix transcriptional regulator [Bacteroidales bacterium]|jgi:DNA-binding HxlR family transcriptional regulator|nr:helix-turn-helix transcriptional regulator [Bacteroidales bacterium]
MKIGICPIDTFIEAFKGKRKSTIMLHLKNETKRYNELVKLIPDISDRMLSKQLKELEQDGFITKKIFPVVPPRVEYSLTDLGKEVLPVLRSMFNCGRILEKSQND